MNFVIYTETIWTLCQAMAENEYKKSERKLRKFVSFTRLSLVSRPLLNKFERLSHNLMENIKDAGMSDKWV